MGYWTLAKRQVLSNTGVVVSPPGPAGSLTTAAIPFAIQETGATFTTFNAARSAAANGQTIVIYPQFYDLAPYVDWSVNKQLKLTSDVPGQRWKIRRLIRNDTSMLRIQASGIIVEDFEIHGIRFDTATAASLGISFLWAGVWTEFGAGVNTLTFRNGLITECNEGILTSANKTTRLTCENVEFYNNGTKAQGVSDVHHLYHGDYVAGGKLTLRGCYFHNDYVDPADYDHINVGHYVKAIVEEVDIQGCYIGAPLGAASDAINMEQCVKAVIQGNVLEESPNSDNPARFIRFGYDPSMRSNLADTGLFDLRFNTLINHGDPTENVVQWGALPGTTLIRNNVLAGTFADAAVHSATNSVVALSALVADTAPLTGGAALATPVAASETYSGFKYVHPVGYAARSDAFRGGVAGTAGLPAWRTGMTDGQVVNIGTLNIAPVLQAGAFDGSQDYSGYVPLLYTGTYGSLGSVLLGGHQGNGVPDSFGADIGNASVSRLGTAPLLSQMLWATGSEAELGTNPTGASQVLDGWRYRYAGSSKWPQLGAGSFQHQAVTYAEVKDSGGVVWPMTTHTYNAVSLLPPGVLGGGSQGSVIVPIHASIHQSSGIYAYWGHQFDIASQTWRRLADELGPPSFYASKSGNTGNPDDYKWMGNNQPNGSHTDYFGGKLYLRCSFDATNPAIAVLDCSGAPGTETWSVLPGNATTFTGVLGGGVCAIGGVPIWVELRSDGTIWYARLDHTEATKHTWVNATLTGGTFPVTTGYGSFNYVPSKNKFFAWISTARGWGNYIRIVTPPATLGGTWTVSSQTLSGVTLNQPAYTADGPQNKMFYFPPADALVYAPSFSSPTTLQGIKVPL